jgi:hypothetical protein
MSKYTLSYLIEKGTSAEIRSAADLFESKAIRLSLLALAEEREQAA